MHRGFAGVLRIGSGALLAVLLASGEAVTQVVPQVITLDDAVEIALDRNPTVQQAENTARLSTLTVRQQQYDLLPDLRVTTATTAPYGRGFGGSNSSLSGGISTTVNVPNVYTTVASMRQSRMNEEGSGHNLTRARQTVMFNVITQYLAVLEAEEQVTVQEGNLTASRAQLAQIQAFFDQGERPISDLYQQQATTAGAELALVQAERGLVVARMNLIRTLQLDPFAEYEFTEPDLAVSTSYESLDLQDLAQRAMAQRPDLAASQLQLSSAEQGVRIANSSRWPSFSMSLGYSTNYSSLGNNDLLDQLDQGRGGTVQLGMSVPIFDSTTGITRERARIQVENAQIGFDNTAQTVATEIRTAYLDLGLAEEQLEVAGLQLRSATLAYETARQRYDVGAATLVEVTQAQATEVRSQTELVNARYSLLLQSRLLEYYLGSLDLNDL